MELITVPDVKFGDVWIVTLRNDSTEYNARVIAYDSEMGAKIVLTDCPGWHKLVLRPYDYIFISKVLDQPVHYSVWEYDDTNEKSSLGFL